MSVAVAGGFGFVGSCVTEKLKEKGYDTVPFSRRNGIDIRNFDAVNRFISSKKPEIVINCAANVGGIAYNALTPVTVYEDNLQIGFNLIRACYENNIKKLVNIMPNCTYPGIAEIYRESEWWNGEMHETVLTYGMPRKALWVQCRAYEQKYGFNSIHLVLPNLYGPGDHFDAIRSHALGALVQKIVDAKKTGKQTVEIWGTGNAIREWGYVADAAEAITIATEKYQDIGILNIGQGIGYTIKEIAQMISEAVGWHGTFVFDTSRPDGAPKKILDVTKMKKVLGWVPETHISDGIKKTVAWYTKNQEKKGD